MALPDWKHSKRDGCGKVKSYLNGYKMYLIRYKKMNGVGMLRESKTGYLDIDCIADSKSCLARDRAEVRTIRLPLWAGHAKELLVFEAKGNQFPSPHTSAIDGEHPMFFDHP
jgi:hypothetical protein